MNLIVDSHPGRRRVLGAGVDGAQYFDIVVNSTPGHNRGFGGITGFYCRVGKDGSAF